MTDVNGNPSQTYNRPLISQVEQARDLLYAGGKRNGDEFYASKMRAAREYLRDNNIPLKVDLLK